MDEQKQEKSTVEEKNLNGVLKIDEQRIEDHLSEMVRSTVEETLNAMLDVEADQLCGAKRYERSRERVDSRAGHYQRQLVTRAGEVTVKVPKLRKLKFETEIIERYRRREASPRYGPPSWPPQRPRHSYWLDSVKHILLRGGQVRFDSLRFAQIYSFTGLGWLGLMNGVGDGWQGECGAKKARAICVSKGADGEAVSHAGGVKRVRGAHPEVRDERTGIAVVLHITPCHPLIGRPATRRLTINC